MGVNFYIFNNGLMVETGVSGSDRRAMEWTKIFLRKGFSVRLYTSPFGQKRFSQYGPNFKLSVIAEPNFLKNTFLVYLYRALAAIGEVKMVKRGSIFYSTSDLLPDSLPALVSKMRFPQTKWVTGLHLIAPNPFKDYANVFRKGFSFPSLRGIYYFLSQRAILFFAKRKADLVLVSNNLDRRMLLSKGFKENQVLVTYGSVEWQQINQAKAKKSQYEAAFIGRYHPQKGLNDLLKAWKAVCHRVKGAKMAMMGELEPLLPEIKKKGLEKNIDFLGFIDGVKKFEKLKESKIFLFPSTYESFGMVACEAMACGLPVVAYDLPIYKDIYPKGMVRVQIGDWQNFAKEVEKLLTSERERKKLASEAKIQATNFSWEKTAAEILRCLNLTHA